MKRKNITLVAAALLAAVLLLPITVSASSFKTSSGITDHGDFTIAVVPDMQVLSGSCPESLSVLTGWIAENAEKENIRFVTFLGDMTDNNKKGEWKDVKAATDLLRGKVNFSVINGNRDMNDKSATRDTLRFTESYPLADFSDMPEFGGAYSEDCLNTYFTFEQGGLKYMILCLEFAPRDEVLAWAGSVVEAHPDYNVIITTHGYLDDDGNVINDSSEDSFHKYPYLGGEGNNGDGIREKLLLKYNNIVLLLCGHRGDGDLVTHTDETADGTKIVSVMANGTDIDEKYEKGTGMVLLLHFKNGSGTVSCEYYSTVIGRYYGNRNQITLELDTVSPDNTSCVISRPSGFGLHPDILPYIIIVAVLVFATVIAIVIRKVKENR